MPKTSTSAVFAFLVLGFVAGCSTTTTSSGGGIAGLAPMLSVERFLQAANTGDLDAMSRIFGTAEGAIADQSGSTLGCAFKRMGSWIGLGERCVSSQDIELRMNAIALILQHDDYQVRSESSVPGRSRPTTRVGVDIERAGEQITDVPFVVVQTTDGRWLVEQIDLARLTAESPLLDELPENTARAPGMYERDQVATGPGSGFGIDELDALGSEPRQLGAKVGNPKGEVM